MLHSHDLHLGELLGLECLATVVTNLADVHLIQIVVAFVERIASLARLSHEPWLHRPGVSLQREMWFHHSWNRMYT